MDMGLFYKFIARRDWSPDPDVCYPWLGTLTDRGYGVIRHEGKAYRAHRLAWFIMHDEWPDLHVLHRCDVRHCVNPNHLFLGTNDDNVADRNAKQRQAKGDSFPQAKLTPELVCEMRELYHGRAGYTQPELANRFGVALVTVQKVVNRQSWKHVK